MRGTITRSNETVLIGLKCDPSQCPRCDARLTTDAIEVNLTESHCVCGYSARDRVGGLRDAQELADSLPPLRIMRARARA